MVPVVTALLLVPSGRSGLAVSMWPCSFFFFFGLLAGDCLWKHPSALALICKVGHVWLSSNPTCVALSSNPTWCCFSCFFFFGFQAGLICFRIQHAQLLGRKALVVGYVWLRKKKTQSFDLGFLAQAHSPSLGKLCCRSAVLGLSLRRMADQEAGRWTELLDRSLSPDQLGPLRQLGWWEKVGPAPWFVLESGASLKFLVDYKPLGMDRVTPLDWCFPSQGRNGAYLRFVKPGPGPSWTRRLTFSRHREFKITPHPHSGTFFGIGASSREALSRSMSAASHPHFWIFPSQRLLKANPHRRHAYKKWFQ